MEGKTILGPHFTGPISLQNTVIGGAGGTSFQMGGAASFRNSVTGGGDRVKSSTGRGGQGNNWIGGAKTYPVCAPEPAVYLGSHV